MTGKSSRDKEQTKLKATTTRIWCTNTKMSDGKNDCVYIDSTHINVKEAVQLIKENKCFRYKLALKVG